MSQNTAAFQSGDEKQQLSNRESNKAGLQLTLNTAQLSGSSAAQQSPVAEFGDTSVRKKPARRRAHRWLGLWRYGHSLKRGVRSWRNLPGVLKAAWIVPSQSAAEELALFRSV
ncbi:hypothetical protein XENORESO_016875 [Xenotaenia resolanae]|uniref:Uncharacterized protein n=1 Tax=Xenotaenia resolanae TaxID=208358 RepID=A0ABV0WYN1_9TELE